MTEQNNASAKGNEQTILPGSLTKRQCAIMLTGFVRGLLIRHGESLYDYPEMVYALEKLGCPKKYTIGEFP